MPRHATGAHPEASRRRRRRCRADCAGGQLGIGSGVGFSLRPVHRLSAPARDHPRQILRHLLDPPCGRDQMSHATDATDWPARSILAWSAAGTSRCSSGRPWHPDLCSHGFMVRSFHDKLIPWGRAATRDRNPRAATHRRRSGSRRLPRKRRQSTARNWPCTSGPRQQVPFWPGNSRQR